MEFLVVKQRQVSLARRIYNLVLAQFHVVLVIGYAIAGWCLCAYAVPQIVWLGTLLVTLHLVRVGVYAVLPALIWINGVLSIGAVNQVWMWQMPIVSYQLIPLTLLGVWLFALGLVLFVAIAHQTLKQKQIPAIRRFYWLIVPISLGLTFGVCVYQLFTLPQIQ